MKKILVIEDERDMREALQTKLISAGFYVDTAETAELGLRSVLQSKPDLIFLDVMTHSIHASEFLLRLHQDIPGGKDCKVIVLTNLDNDATRKKVTDYGIEAYLIKSQTSLELVVAKAQEVLGE